VKIRVGFIINFKSRSWLGGYNYFKNLFLCLKENQNQKIIPVLITDNNDDELRKEKLSNFWRKYKYFFIFFVLLIVLAVSGIQFNQYKKSENRKMFVEKYFESLDTESIEAKIKSMKKAYLKYLFSFSKIIICLTLNFILTTTIGCFL